MDQFQSYTQADAEAEGSGHRPAFAASLLACMFRKADTDGYVGDERTSILLYPPEAASLALRSSSQKQSLRSGRWSSLGAIRHDQIICR